MQNHFDMMLKISLLIIGFIFLAPVGILLFDTFTWVLFSEGLSFVEWSNLKIVVSLVFSTIGAFLISLSLS